jgi:hypothetical protein
MKLTETQLEEGRVYIRANDIDALGRWIEAHKVIIDRVEVLKTFRRIAPADPERAIKLFDKVFEDMDPVFDRRVILWRLGFRIIIVLVVALGCIGGIVYLVKTVF